VGIGVLMAGRGVGALIGPFLGRRLAGPDDRRLFSAIGFALALFGLGYVALGVMPGLWAAALAVGVAHLGGGAQWTLSSYGLQRIVPDHIRGRIFAFDYALITVTLAVSASVTAWAADRFGARPTVIVLGGIAMLWAVVWTWLTTDVRRSIRTRGTEPDPDLEAIARPATGPA
jgi:MFS family permease